jgi:DNA-directed RNA polymerase specialized sigma24 family protein
VGTSDAEKSADLLARWMAGDQAAADALFGRYTEQLVALARDRLSTRLAGRLDPEDVVQSAYRSFFSNAESFVIERVGDLWRLLAAITLHKLHHQVDRHTAARRSVTRERPLGNGRSPEFLVPAARDPSPAEAVALIDEVEHLLRGLPPLHRRMLELRLQGFRIAEIAADTRRSERLVRKVLDGVKAELIRTRGDGEADDPRPTTGTGKPGRPPS